MAAAKSIRPVVRRTFLALTRESLDAQIDPVSTGARLLQSAGPARIRDMTRKTVSVSVVVPDTSPLITLGRIQRLDILSCFTVPIHLIDVVVEEARRPHNDANGAVGLWLARRPNNVVYEETLVGEGLRARRARGESPATGNLGEIAVDEYATRLAKEGSASHIPLILFEDPDVLELRIARLKNVHLLNTAGLLIGLHQLGLMPDATDVLDQINGLRATPMRPIDRPVRTHRHQSTFSKIVTKEGWQR